MTNHRIVSREEWVSARKALLEKEKELTHLRDELAEARRELPWVRLEKRYELDGPNGRQTLAETFGDKSQLVVYHFMFGPTWKEGCPLCSFWADNFERNVVHLAHRDVALVAISRAPLATIEAYRQRMGWTFPWLSSGNTDFNFDFHVSATPEELDKGEAEYNYRIGKAAPESPGISVFFKDEDGAVYHTYSAYARGLDMMNAAYHYLDLTPKGRDEAALSWPMAWVRRRDSY